MQVEVCATPAAAAARAADLIAESVQGAIAERGLAAVALSGGKTPAGMLTQLATKSLEWSRVHIFQVDERLVPEGDDRSNMKFIRAAFAETGIPPSQFHAMPVGAISAEAGAVAYTDELRSVTGATPMLDIVHLGLGGDGHTASLFPGDSAVGACGDVSVSGVHGGVRRMTLTLAVLDRARVRVWLVTGGSKRAVIERFLERDAKLVAARVRSDDSFLILDSVALAGP